MATVGLVSELSKHISLRNDVSRGFTGMWGNFESDRLGVFPRLCRSLTVAVRFFSLRDISTVAYKQVVALADPTPGWGSCEAGGRAVSYWVSR